VLLAVPVAVAAAIGFGTSLSGATDTVNGTVDNLVGGVNDTLDSLLGQ
jgi:hypothetical protein